MSCRKGSQANTRNRPQKYKNRTAFRNDLHDTSPALKLMNSIQVCEVCQHCKSVIEWKIKYKKYKVLTQQKTCRRCNQKTIKRAYHVLCSPCAKEERVCAKCCKSSSQVEIEPPAPTQEEENKLKMELEQLIKSLPERKRRTYLRFAKKGKKAAVPEDDHDNDGEIVEKKKKKKGIPHSRDDLLKKIELLKIDEGDLDSDDFDEDSGEEDDDDDDEGDFSDSD